MQKLINKDTIESSKKWGNSLEITGEIKEIIYRNEINSYTIAVLETREEETTTVRVSSFYK